MSSFTLSDLLMAITGNIEMNVVDYDEHQEYFGNPREIVKTVPRSTKKTEVLDVTIELQKGRPVLVVGVQS